MAPIQKVGGTNWNALPLECCYCLQPMALPSRLYMPPCELSCYEENSDRWVAPIQKVGGTNWNADIACSLWHGSLGCACSHASSPATRKTQIGGWHQFKRWLAPIGMLFKRWVAPIGMLAIGMLAIGMLEKDQPGSGKKVLRLPRTFLPESSNLCRSLTAIRTSPARFAAARPRPPTVPSPRTAPHRSSFL